MSPPHDRALARIRTAVGRVDRRVRTAAARVTMESRFRFLRRFAPDKHDMRVIGLRRSGNHAIIGWILAQHRGASLFLNEALPAVSPHRTRLRSWHWQPARDRATPPFLLYSYEDQALLAVVHPTRRPYRTFFAGPSAVRSDLLILRDPFNLAASRLQWGVERPDRVRTALELWKSYAREFVGDLNTLPFKIPVSFNAWTSDRAYREQLAARLGLPFTDAGFEDVHGFGGGSSFDGTAFDGRASAMAVHDRWRRRVDDPTFRQIAADPELHELSARIFGVIPGTEALR